MKGILLLSHGDMAKGMLQSSSIFFGEDLPQVEALGFQMTDDSDEFEKKIVEAIKRVDDGDGVIVLCDLFAGTPAHKTTKYVKQGKVDVICGMNLPLFMEILSSRETNDVDLNYLMDVAKGAIKPWQVVLSSNSDDDFF